MHRSGQIRVFALRSFLVCLGLSSFCFSGFSPAGSWPGFKSHIAGNRRFYLNQVKTPPHIAFDISYHGPEALVVAPPHRRHGQTRKRKRKKKNKRSYPGHTLTRSPTITKIYSIVARKHVGKCGTSAHPTAVISPPLETFRILILTYTRNRARYCPTSQ